MLENDPFQKFAILIVALAGLIVGRHLSPISVVSTSAERFCLHKLDILLAFSRCSRRQVHSARSRTGMER